MDQSQTPMSQMCPRHATSGPLPFNDRSMLLFELITELSMCIQDMLERFVFGTATRERCVNN